MYRFILHFPFVLPSMASFTNYAMHAGSGSRLGSKLPCDYWRSPVFQVFPLNFYKHDQWLHEQYLQQVWSVFSPCRKHWSSRSIFYPFHYNVTRNIYRVPAFQPPCPTNFLKSQTPTLSSWGVLLPSPPKHTKDSFIFPFCFTWQKIHLERHFQSWMDLLRNSCKGVHSHSNGDKTSFHLRE